MRGHLLIALTILINLGGCAKRDDSPTVAAALSAPVQSQGASAKLEPAEQSRRSIAYEHAIAFDTREDRVVTVFEAGKRACAEAAADECVVLEASLRTGDYVSATLRLRARPAGIQKVISALSAQGSVTTQSTMAEDLAAPLDDSARKLAMLQDYREKLLALRQLASRDIDALIKVNKELAQVQADIEARTGERANLLRRVETEVLRINIDSRRSRSFWAPILLASSDFTTDLSAGISGVITAVAYLVPWGIALLALAWAANKLWRRWRRQRSGQ